MEKKIAILCARASKLAYTDNVEIRNFQLTAKFENAGTDTQGIFGDANGDTLVIAFRGSEETGISDWITDLKITKKAFPFVGGDLKVHSGFLGAYQSVRENVIQFSKDSPHKKILCAGHSLGGGLALLAAFDLANNVPGKDIAVYTFGQPKVGDGAFASACKKKLPNHFRFINGSDIVPSSPPGSYEHSGKPVQLGEPGGITDIKGKVEDHLPNQYINAVQKM